MENNPMDYKPLGSLLVENGFINNDMLSSALSEQADTDERLATILVRLGYLSEDERLRALSMQFNIPRMTAREFPQKAPFIDCRPSIKFLKQYKTVPVERVNGTLRLAISDPLDAFPVEAMKHFTGLEVEAALGCEQDILDAIDAYYGAGSVTVNKIIEKIGDKEYDNSYEPEDVEHLKDMASEAPIINLVNLIITRAVEKQASDIHIEPFEADSHVRYRIDGILHHVESVPRGLHPSIISRIKIIAKLNIAERRLPQDGRIKLNILDKAIDIRVSTVPTLYGESIVMRLLDPTGVKSLHSLGLSSGIEAAFTNLIRQPHGMVLVTGPTGSGKSTTLYASFSKMETHDKKIITIEDPIEYNINGINQIQVNPKICLSFANGLRSIVRQDPDIIMVGEIRDAETAEISIHSALTGHLVLSTLHTNDAPSAVIRLLDMGIEGYLVSSSLIGVLAQRLVRVICAKCKTEDTPDSEMLQVLTEGLSPQEKKRYASDFKISIGTGCDLCGQTGYKGRTGIFEFMPMNDSMRKLILENKGADILRKKAIDDGMVSLRLKGLEKARLGITTIQEVARVTLQES